MFICPALIGINHQRHPGLISPAVTSVMVPSVDPMEMERARGLPVL